MQTYELSTQYDSRKSFYGKAKVETDLDGAKKLISYTTHVATIHSDGTVKVYGTYSNTTLRHIKEFLKQFDARADSAKQIMKDYAL